MKKLYLFFVVVCVGFLFTGCDKNEFSSLEINSDSFEYDENFTLSDVKIKAIRKDGTYEVVPLNEDMLSENDLVKFSQLGTHNIKVSYLNNATEFTITITGEKGDDGVDGREIELQVDSDNLQWRYQGESTWKNLIALTTLTGANGETGPTGETGPKGETGPIGADGDSVSFQITNEHIQWKYSKGDTWYNLIELSALKGKDGTNGETPIVTINDDGFWVINGIATTYVAVIPQNKYTVTFELNGGVLPDGASATLSNVVSGTNINLPIPSKEYYIFAGWYTGYDANSSKFSNADAVTNNLTLHAKWDVDYSYLEDFFVLLKNYNFSANIKKFENDYILSSVYNIQKTGDAINLYQNKEEIYHYESSNTNKRILIIHDYLINENKIRLEKNGDKGYTIDGDSSARLDSILGFSDINPVEFTKRDGVRIYDYETYYYDFGKKFSEKVTIDLDLLKITSIDGEFSREITFSNVGTTIVEFPLSLFKETIKNSFDIYASQLSLNTATDEKVAMFNNRLAEMKSLIDITDGIIELNELRNDLLEELRNYELDIDDFKATRVLLLEKLRFEEFNSLYFPTEESLLEMQVILNEYTNLIMNCPNYLELHSTFEKARTSLYEAYVFDYEGSKLQEYKNSAKSKISSEIGFGFFFSKNVNNLQDIYMNFSEMVEPLNTYEEIDELVNLFIIKFKDIEDSEFNIYETSGYKAENLSLLKYSYDYGRTCYYNRYEEIEILYKDAVDGINATRNPYIIRDLFNDSISLLELLNMKYTKIYSIEKLVSAKEYKMLRVADVDIPTLNEYYEIALTQIDISNSFDEILTIRKNYASLIYAIPSDVLKESIISRTFEIESIFESYKKTATDASIIEIESIFNSNILLIENCTTEAEVNALYVDIFTRMQGQYIEDPIKFRNNRLLENRYEYFNIKVYFMWQFLNDEDKDTLSYMSDKLKDNLESMSAEQFSIALALWEEEVSKQPFNINYYNYDLKRYDLILGLYGNYENVIDNLHTYDYYYDNYFYDLEILFEDSLHEIFNTYNPLVLVENVINLQDELIAYYKQKLIDYLDVEAEEIRMSIYDTDIPAFENELTVTKDKISNYIRSLEESIDLLDLDKYVDEFFMYVESLDFDYSKEELEWQKSYLEQTFELLSAYATDASIQNMSLARDKIFLALETNGNIGDEAGVQLSNEFFSSFVKDDVKFQFNVRKDQINKVIHDSLSEIDLFIVEDLEFIKLYVQTSEQLNTATTITELNTIYDDWKLEVRQIPYNIYSTNDYKVYLRDQLIGFVVSDLHLDESSSVYTSSNQALNLIANSIDFIDGLINYYEGYENIKAINYQELRSKLSLEATELYNEKKFTALEAELTNVELYYLQDVIFLQIMHNEETEYTFYEYLQNLYYVNTDDVKDTKYSVKWELDHITDDYINIITNDSLLLITSKIDEYKLMVDQKTTVEEIWQLLEQASIEIDGLKVIDDEKLALQNINYSMYDRIDFIYSEYSDVNMRNYICYIYESQYRYQMTNSTTISEFNILYNSWYEFMIQQDLEIVNIDKDNYINYLAYLYDYITPTFSEVEELEYINYKNEIINSDNSFIIINAYTSANLLLNKFR